MRGYIKVCEWQKESSEWNASWEQMRLGLEPGAQQSWVTQVTGNRGGKGRLCLPSVYLYSSPLAKQNKTKIYSSKITVFYRHRPLRVFKNWQVILRPIKTHWCYIYNIPKPINKAKCYEIVGRLEGTCRKGEGREKLLNLRSIKA